LGLVWGHPQIIRLGPRADFADLCSEPVFALIAELDEGDDDRQAAEERAGRCDDRGPVHVLTVVRLTLGVLLALGLRRRTGPLGADLFGDHLIRRLFRGCCQPGYMPGNLAEWCSLVRVVSLCFALLYGQNQATTPQPPRAFRCDQRYIGQGHVLPTRMMPRVRRLYRSPLWSGVVVRHCGSEQERCQVAVDRQLKNAFPRLVL
jgi:hypothetical protein